MRHATFPQMIAERFRYLVDGYGFSIVYQSIDVGFGDQTIVLASNRCRVLFTLDRGDVFIRVASADSPETWAPGLPDIAFDIGLVVGFLTPGTTAEQLARFYPPTDRTLPDRANVNQQLGELAHRTRPYWDRVLALCESGELNRHRSELEELGKQRGEAIIRRLIEKGPRGSTDSTSP